MAQAGRRRQARMSDIHRPVLPCVLATAPGLVPVILCPDMAIRLPNILL